MKLLRGIPEYVHRGSFWQNKLLWHEKTNKQTDGAQEWLLLQRGGQSSDKAFV